MKTYNIILSTTLDAENEKQARERIVNDLSNGDARGIWIDEVKEIKYRYITFQELLDMYAAPKSVIKNIIPITNNSLLIKGFKIIFYGNKDTAFISNEDFSQIAPDDAPEFLIREVSE